MIWSVVECSEVECELRVLAQEIEGEAMVGRGAMKPDGFAMHLGRVTLVAVGIGGIAHGSSS